MKNMKVVDKFFAKPLRAEISHFILLHVQLLQAHVDFEHAGKVLSDLVHPIVILVVRHWSVDVQRNKCRIIVQNS